MSGREILTLQFGHYSNFVGTHLWNIQEFTFDYNSDRPSEINHDVFYREGLTYKNQVTFTPRTLLLDLKGALKSLPEHGTLYEQERDPGSVKKDIAWNENSIEVQEEQKCENKIDAVVEGQQNITNLDASVSVWSDFLYSRFHPRTVNILKEYEHENKDKAFDVFPLGRNLWENVQEDFTDKIRQYLEECDNFQGFQVLLDANNAFSGLASACLEHLQDEYERKSIFALPVIPAHYTDYFDFDTTEAKCQSLIKDSLTVINTALCFADLTEKSSLFVPLSVGSNGWRQPGAKRNFNHVVYDHKSSFQSSAILATAIDTFTLQYRLRTSSYSLRDLCCDLTPGNRKMAAASVCMPFSINEDDFLLDTLDNWDGPLTKTITPSCNIGSDRVMQTITLRGVPETRLKRPLKQLDEQINMPAYKCDNVKSMLNYYLSCTTYASANQVTVVENGMPVNPFYPQIFDSRVGRNGGIVHKRPAGLSVESIPVMGGLHTGSEIGTTLECLHREAAKIKYERLHQFNSTGLELDDFRESLEKLLELKECYEEALL